MISNKNTVIKIAYYLLALVVIYFFVVMTKMITPYFPYQYRVGFLTTKADELLQNKFYLAAFYVHITSSFFALGIGIFQFWPAFIRKYKSVHRILGMLYVYSILLFSCPSGLVLGINANGGFAAQVGFSMQCVVWFVVTFLAVQKAVQKKWLAHVQYMIISYAVTLAAFSLRTESYWIQHLWHTKLNETYIAVAWLSWVGNLLIALVLIEMGLANRIVKKVFHS